MPWEGEMKRNSVLVVKIFIQIIVFSVLINFTSFSFAIRPPSDQPQGDEWIKRGEEAPPGGKLGVYKNLSLELNEFSKDSIVNEINTYLSEFSQEITNLPHSDFKLHYSIEIPANRVHDGIVYVEHRQTVDGIEIPYSSLRFMVKSTPEGPLLVNSRSKLFYNIVFENQTLLNPDVVEQIIEGAKKLQK